MFGGIGGFVAGLLGIGGAPIYVLIFEAYLGDFYSSEALQGAETQLMIANTVFARLFASASGSYKQYTLHNFHPKMALTLAIPATVVALLTTYLLSFVNYSKVMFSVIFILMFIPIILRMLFQSNQPEPQGQPKKVKNIFLWATGGIAGIITAFTGLGGGFFIVPLLNSVFNIRIKKVVSISLTMIFFVSIFFTLNSFLSPNPAPGTKYSLGLINFALCLPVVIGVIISAPLGVMSSRRISSFKLRILFIVFCAFVIGRTTYNLLIELGII